ncbi:MAG: hypothetical protein HS117_16425 [Verrucomicrobiaceae bacterium]|nr:hypothetical protein [Verrucomicrobiaceae bacterium]
MRNLSLLAALLLMMTGVCPLRALNWDFQTVRDAYFTAVARSVTVGTDGRVHVVYSALPEFGNEAELDHAVRTPATSWVVTTLASIPSSNLYGSAAVKCDSFQHPYVIYRQPSGGVQFRRHTGTAWASAVNFAGSGGSSQTLAVAIDSANDLHLGYTVTGGTLRYAFWDRSASSISYRDEVHDFTYVFEQVSLLLHPTSERPRMTYSRNGHLTYAVRGSTVTSAWTSEIVRSNSVSANSIAGGSMAFKGTTAYASYYDPANQSVYLASDSGNPWARELVGSFDMESVSSISPATRLFFDSAERPYIVWRRSGGDLYVSSKRGSSWKTALIAHTSEADFGAAMHADRLYVAYATPDRTTVRLATAGVSPAAEFGGWAESVFTPTQLADPLVSGVEADPDLDGVANLLEFAFNMPPLNAGVQTMAPGTGTQGLPASTLEIGAGGAAVIRIEFLRRRATVNSGLTYQAEFSSSMTSGTWTPAGGTTTVTPINDDWERVVVLDAPPAGSQRRFVRVRVTQEL